VPLGKDPQAEFAMADDGDGDEGEDESMAMDKKIKAYMVKNSVGYAAAMKACAA
jgi:hypothetical protein